MTREEMAEAYATLEALPVMKLVDLERLEALVYELTLAVTHRRQKSVIMAYAAFLNYVRSCESPPF